MGESEQAMCLFRRLNVLVEAEQDGIDSFGSQDEDLAAGELDDAQVAAHIEALACKVGGCAIGFEALLAYATGNTDATVRPRIDEIAADSCAILDMVHESDTDLAQAYDHLQGPDQA